jgi:hypothetical protein
MGGKAVVSPKYAEASAVPPAVLLQQLRIRII